MLECWAAQDLRQAFQVEVPLEWRLRAGSFEEWVCLVAVQQECWMLRPRGCWAWVAVAQQACHLQIDSPATASWAVAQQGCHLQAPVSAIPEDRQLVVEMASLA